MQEYSKNTMQPNTIAHISVIIYYTYRPTMNNKLVTTIRQIFLIVNSFFLLSGYQALLWMMKKFLFGIM